MRPVFVIALLAVSACATDPAGLGESGAFAPKSLLTTGTTTLSGLSVGEASGAGDLNSDG